MLRRHGVASLLELISASEGLPARLLARGRRRTGPHRPPPRRPAPPHRGHHRGAGHDGPHRLAAPTHRRSGGGHQQRGTHPAPRVRRRSGAGPHHPPQQGARVPGRLPAVPVGAGLRAAALRRRLPRRPQRQRPHDRRQPGGRRARSLARPPQRLPRRAAGGGPAPGLRRPHPGQAPGGAVVGGREGQRELGAVPPPLRPGRRRQRPAPSTTGCPTTTRSPELSRPSGPRPPAASRWNGSPRPAGLRYTPPAPEAVDLAAGRFERRAGPSLAPHLLHRDHLRRPRPPRRQRAGAGGKDRRARRRTDVTGLSRRRRRTRMRLREVASLWAGLAGGADVGTFVHRVLERIDFTVPDLDGGPDRRGGAGREPAAAGDDRRGGGGGRAAGGGGDAAGAADRRTGAARLRPGGPAQRAALRVAAGRRRRPNGRGVGGGGRRSAATATSRPARDYRIPPGRLRRTAGRPGAGRHPAGLPVGQPRPRAADSRRR